MNLLSCQDYDELSAKASTLLVQKIKKIIAQKGKCILAISGGRSVAGLLQKLSSQDLDWSKVEIFMIDERVVPLDNKDSNYQQVQELFLKRVNVKAHPFLIEKGVEEYNQQFQRAGAHFDIIVLGAGEDGHVAALFPGHAVLKIKEKKYLQINDSPKPPKERITASPDIIRDADIIILIFSSAGKKKAYGLFIDQKISQEKCPAKIALGAKELFVFTEFS